MATILIQSVDHKTSNYAGSGGHDHYVPINLGETLDFRNTEFLKRGAFPVGFDGKLVKATTAKPIAGFLDPQVIGALNGITGDFPVTGDQVGLMSGFVARVDVAKTAGTPVYIDDNGQFSDTAGTASIIVGYYKNYNPKRVRGAEFTSKVVEFDVRFAK